MRVAAAGAWQRLGKAVDSSCCLPFKWIFMARCAAQTKAADGNSVVWVKSVQGIAAAGTWQRLSKAVTVDGGCGLPFKWITKAGCAADVHTSGAAG
jgi:hypothetical protein